MICRFPPRQRYLALHIGLNPLCKLAQAADTTCRIIVAASRCTPQVERSKSRRTTRPMTAVSRCATCHGMKSQRMCQGGSRAVRAKRSPPGPPAPRRSSALTPAFSVEWLAQSMTGTRNLCCSASLVSPAGLPPALLLPAMLAVELRCVLTSARGADSTCCCSALSPLPSRPAPEEGLPLLVALPSPTRAPVARSMASMRKVRVWTMPAACRKAW